MKYKIVSEFAFEEFPCHSQKYNSSDSNDIFDGTNYCWDRESDTYIDTPAKTYSDIIYDLVIWLLSFVFHTTQENEEKNYLDGTYKFVFQKVELPVLVFASKLNRLADGKKFHPFFYKALDSFETISLTDIWSPNEPNTLWDIEELELFAKKGLKIDNSLLAVYVNFYIGNNSKIIDCLFDKAKPNELLSDNALPSEVLFDEKILNMLRHGTVGKYCYYRWNILHIIGQLAYKGYTFSRRENEVFQSLYAGSCDGQKAFYLSHISGSGTYYNHVPVRMN